MKRLAEHYFQFSRHSSLPCLGFWYDLPQTSFPFFRTLYNEDSVAALLSPHLL